MMISREEYIGIIEALIRQIPSMEENNKGHQNIGEYFVAHGGRMYEAVSIMETKIPFKAGFTIHELGAVCPYMSYPFVYKYGAISQCTSIQTKKMIIQNGVMFRYSNLCFDDFGTELYDLVITTEMFEHLYCDLMKLRTNIGKSVKVGGYWFLSFPTCGGTGCNWGVLPKPEEQYIYRDEHVREFNPDMEREFTNIEGFELIDSRQTGWIHQYLFRRIK